ncbi:transketolase [Steroidobacter agaridevorans]|uniref:transketolase n=1 Tax=Steroidobacter agaridevorans TaxID=2695856 RepID=UPI00132B3D9E|nr:transketolase [Steroidobacter agaridevorans]GFE87745.1 transketolase, N-terminal subunit [Steroidobacter agaridevorans]
MSASHALGVSDRELMIKSLEYRKDVLRIISHAGAGHTGGSLSSIDILNVLYNRVMRISPARFDQPDRDRYIQSKGHCVEALYVVLADLGFFPRSQLTTLCEYGSHFIGHPTRKVPGVEHNTGALGHGLAFGVGLALGLRHDDLRNRVFVLLGDGELAEGSVWEAAMAAAHYELDQLVAIVDRNRLQITGPTKDVLSSEPLESKFGAFGWHVRTVDGHNVAALTNALTVPPPQGKPMVLLADTIKGKGVSFMEGVLKWHHGVPDVDEYRRAMEELGAALRQVGGHQ